MKKKIFFITALLLLLAGCSSTKVDKETELSETTSKTPEMQVSKAAALGETFEDNGFEISVADRIYWTSDCDGTVYDKYSDIPDREWENMGVSVEIPVVIKNASNDTGELDICVLYFDPNGNQIFSGGFLGASDNIGIGEEVDGQFFFHYERSNDPENNPDGTYQAEWKGMKSTYLLNFDVVRDNT